jgi:hypothetical protein
MAIDQPDYTIPNPAILGNSTHITDHNYVRDALVELKTQYLLPPGGTSGYVLKKASGSTGDYVWAADGGGGGVSDHPSLTARDTVDSHPTSAITGLDSALASKTDTGHTHSIASVTNLQTTLDGKAATSHTHNASAITAGFIDIARATPGTTITVDKVKNSNVWPARPTSRTDISVVWIGNTTPPGSSIDGDRWIEVT